MSIFFILHFAFCILFLSCKNENPRTFSPAFYHWQTQLKISSTERQLMDSLNIKKLYVKFFDIDINENNEPVPNAVVEIDSHLIIDLEIIPTIFITNRTFINIPKKKVEKLAENIFNKLIELFSLLPSTVNRQPFEIQFDCDWTQTTRDNYFYFLNYFKSKLIPTNMSGQNSKLSATIRLHQLKYPDQTGLPPVDKGMLMFYNMGELDNWETENSILDIRIAERYLPPIHHSPFTIHHYPLPLDLALPIFKWGVIFRNNELVYLINNLSEKEIQDTARFTNLAENRYEVKRSTYLEGYYLYAGDLIRLEGVDRTLLEDVSARLSKFSKLEKPEQKECIISFYHLDTTTLSSFKYKDFEKILDQFNTK
ncbi:MAG: hypothetical protein R2825_04215 [Saprospiraceae bacterium]